MRAIGRAWKHEQSRDGSIADVCRNRINMLVSNRFDILDSFKADDLPGEGQTSRLLSVVQTQAETINDQARSIALSKIHSKPN